MKISYFDDKTWSEITRDERYFCFELYNCLKQNQRPFLDILSNGIQNVELKNILDANNFDVGVEVCFYRDLAFHFDRSIRKLINENKLEKSVMKRTFDLTLFSDEAIFIIEAKAQQGFDTEQMDVFLKDIDQIEKLLKLLGKPIPNIYLVGLHSHWYKPKDTTRKYFDSLITWKELEISYPRSQKLFKRANDIYPHKKSQS